MTPVPGIQAYCRYMRERYWREDLIEAIKKKEVQKHNILFSLHNSCGEVGSARRVLGDDICAIVIANAETLADNLLERYLPKDK